MLDSIMRYRMYIGLSAEKPPTKADYAVCAITALGALVVIAGLVAMMFGWKPN